MDLFTVPEIPVLVVNDYCTVIEKHTPGDQRLDEDFFSFQGRKQKLARQGDELLQEARLRMCPGRGTVQKQEKSHRSKSETEHPPRTTDTTIKKELYIVSLKGMLHPHKYEKERASRFLKLH